MQIKEALQQSQRLHSLSDSAEADVELLLCHVLQKPRSYLFTWPDRSLSESECADYHRLFDRRLQGEPVAHIIGMRGFWSFDLEVSPQTLIPRADTEVLVEKALELCPQAQARVADLGTGTGAIALALASEKPQWQVVASDFIAAAAELAERNRARLQLDNVSILHGSWFQPHSGRYDLIVSNPPYIDPQDEHLAQGDLRFEPLTALTAEGHGLADIQLIVEQAPDYLNPQGLLIFEHGYDQGERCRQLLQAKGFQRVATARDYGQNERISFGYWPG